MLPALFQRLSAPASYRYTQAVASPARRGTAGKTMSIIARSVGKRKRAPSKSLTVKAKKRKGKTRTHCPRATYYGIECVPLRMSPFAAAGDLTSLPVYANRASADAPPAVSGKTAAYGPPTPLFAQIRRNLPKQKVYYRNNNPISRYKRPSRAPKPLRR